MHEISLSGNDAALFVSDIHLCEDEPDIADHFFSRLDEWLTRHTHLVILGDLFESWCGDDSADAVAMQLIVKLKTKSLAGLKTFVMRGNRDFLIDQTVPASGLGSFTEQIGAKLLPDECILDAFGERWLLCHGDQLCTLDIAYQDFRKQSRSEKWQQGFLVQARDERLKKATQMRALSRAHQREANNHAIYDVEPQAVTSLLASFNARSMLHGHTHKPAIHPLPGGGERWVLSDWAVEPIRGDAVSFSVSGPERLL